MKPTTILEDKRPIRSISMNTDGSFLYTVGGPTNLSMITPYAESDNSLWFGIYIGTTLVERANGRNVAFIVYFDGTVEPPAPAQTN